MTTRRTTVTLQLTSPDSGPFVLDRNGDRFEVTYAMQSTSHDERGVHHNALLMGRRVYKNGNQATNAVEVRMPITTTARHTPFQERYAGTIR